MRGYKELEKKVRFLHLTQTDKMLIPVDELCI